MILRQTSVGVYVYMDYDPERQGLIHAHSMKGWIAHAHTHTHSHYS